MASPMTKVALMFALLGCASWAGADVLMKWDRKPLPIPLQKDQERIVFVDKNVKVGFPRELEGKIRVQSTGGAVYLKALDVFPSTRFQLRDVATGELILLDVSAKSAINNPKEPIRFLYDQSLSSQTANTNQDDVESLGLDISEVKTRRPQLPVPAALTRYAAQSLYAPLRAVEPLDGVQRVAHRLPAQITTLLPGFQIRATPLMSWKLDDYVVTAIKLQNRSDTRVTLDPRELQGRFYAATFQHPYLGGVGTPEDTTTLYLVTEGYANNAIIPEGKLVKPKKVLRRTTVVKKTVKKGA